MAKRSKSKHGVDRKALSIPSRNKGVQTLSPFQNSLWVIAVPILLAVGAFGIYWPSLGSDFVYDARKEILEEGFVTDLGHLPEVLSLKVLGMNLLLGDRPGQMVYLMFNAAIWGKEPWGYHLASNLLQAANVVLLFLLLRRVSMGEFAALTRRTIFRGQMALAVPCLLFAWHPMAVEPVSAINYSSDLLVTFFTLLALLAATSFEPKNVSSAWSMGGAGVFCALAAVTCKESGLAAVLLLVVYWRLFRHGESKGPWLLFLGAAGSVTVLFLAARFAFAPPIGGPVPYLGGSFGQVFLIQPRLWVFMMGQMLWPTHLSADYTLENIDGVPMALALVVLAIILGLQAWLAWRSPVGGLGVAIYWMGLVTVSNFMPLYRIEADRFYYLPMAGVAMQLAASLHLLLAWRPRFFWLAMVPTAIALAPLALLNLARQQVFANEYSLWNDTVDASPFSTTAHDDLALAYLLRGQMDKARVEEQKALTIAPNDAEAHNNLGVALFNEGETEEAMGEYERAIGIDPKYAEAHYDLGNAFLQKGREDEAITEYEKALGISPNLLEAHCNLGTAFLRKGRVDDAVIQYQVALKLNPAYPDAHNNLGNALKKKGDLAGAIAEYREALRLNPGYEAARENLARAEAQTK